MMQLVVCEHVVAIRKHLREVTEAAPVNLGGHYPRPLTLCGKEAAWDTRLPVGSADCFDCLVFAVIGLGSDR